MYVPKAKAEKNEDGQMKINYLEKGKDEQRASVENWARILGRMQLGVRSYLEFSEALAFLGREH